MSQTDQDEAVSSSLEDIIAQQQAMFDAFAAEVKQQIKENFHVRDWWASVRGFIDAVDWREKWILSILALDLTLILAVIFTRKNVTLQMALLVIIGAIVGLSERLNSWAADNWERFATQNYFDKHGVFLVTVLSGPLVFAMFLQVVFYLWDSFHLMVKMKTKQIKHELRQKARREREGAAAGGVAAEGGQAPEAAAADVGEGGRGKSTRDTAKKRE